MLIQLTKKLDKLDIITKFKFFLMFPYMYIPVAYIIHNEVYQTAHVLLCLFLGILLQQQ